MLVSVQGIRDRPQRTNPPVSWLRMRFENNGSADVTFDPRSLELVTGTLEAFPFPDAPAGPIDLAPGQAASIMAYFPFPPGRNLDNLSLDSLHCAGACNSTIKLCLRLHTSSEPPPVLRPITSHVPRKPSRESFLQRMMSRARASMRPKMSAHWRRSAPLLGFHRFSR